MKKFIYILFIFLWGTLFSIKTSYSPVINYSMHDLADAADDDSGHCYDMHKFILSDFDDAHTEMLAADVNQLGSLAASFRVMVKLTARQIYNTSVYWAKYAVRMIAEYIQHQSFIIENLNSNRFRIGMTGSHIKYLYQLCHIII